MECSLLSLREEAYEALGVTELPVAGHQHYEMGLRVVRGAVRRCLEGHTWFFARRRVRLVCDEEGECVLPEDFLVLLWCSVGGYELVGRVLRCGGSAGGGCVDVMFVSGVCVDGLLGGGVVELPGYFVDCVVLMAAERLAMAVTGSMDVRLRLRQLYEGALDDAKLVDVRQYGSNGRVVEVLDECEGVDGVFFPPV